MTETRAVRDVLLVYGKKDNSFSVILEVRSHQCEITVTEGRHMTHVSTRA